MVLPFVLWVALLWASPNFAHEGRVLSDWETDVSGKEHAVYLQATTPRLYVGLQLQTGPKEDAGSQAEVFRITFFWCW